MEQLSQQSNSLFPFKLVEVLEAKSKVRPLRHCLVMYCTI